MRRLVVTAFLTSALILAAPAFAKTVAMREAQSVALLAPSGKPLSERQVRDAIVYGGALRRWTLDKEEPRRITLRNVIRGKHTVIVAIDYTANSLKVEYVGSENLNYQLRGDRYYIHPKYYEWTDNLVQDIRTKLPMN